MVPSASVLQAHVQATLVGQTTGGMGTILNEFGLSDGSALLLATERWLTPDGSVIRHQGSVPEMDVALEVDSQQLMPRTAKELSPSDLEASGNALLLQVF